VGARYISQIWSCRISCRAGCSFQVPGTANVGGGFGYEWSCRNVYHRCTGSCKIELCDDYVLHFNRTHDAHPSLVASRLQVALGSAPPTVELLGFVEFARYDEATNLMAADQGSDITPLTGPAHADDADALVVAGPGNPWQGQTLTEIAPAKLFQTEISIQALVRVHKGDASPPEYIIFGLDPVCPPQVLQRTTAEIIGQALLQSSPVRWRCLQNFRLRARVTTSDRYAAQFGAERHVQATRPGWQRLHLPCEIHKSTAVQAKGLLLVDDAIAGMIRFALSLRLGGWMRIFHRALIREVVDTIEIQEGESSVEAKAYRQVSLSVFMGVGHHRKIVQAIMGSLPNGDWRRQDVVQVFVRHGVHWDRRLVSQLVARGFLRTLAKTSFRIFNRNRWCGNDIAINQLGLFQSCHGLLGRVFKRFLVAVGYKGSLDRLMPGPSAAPPSETMAELAHPLAEADVVDDDLHPPDTDHAPPADHDMADGVAQPDDPINPAPMEQPGVATGEIDWAVVNEINRSKALAWINRNPLQDLIIVRLCMEPSMAILRKQLFIGSAAWERAQHAAGLAAGGDPRQRDYRLLYSARGELDAGFATHQEHLFTSHVLWSILPTISCTEATRCLCFRIVSRCSAEYERILGWHHRRPPYLLFMLVHHPEVAQTLRALPTCMLDPFTKSFMEQHDLDDPVTPMLLLLILSKACTDTSRIECWHAWVRRMLVKRSSQTHRMHFFDASSRTFAHRVQARSMGECEWLRGEAPTEAQQAGHDAAQAEDAPARRRPRRGGGGEWRAYVSRQMRAGVRSFEEMGRSYALRTEAERQHDRQVGAAATIEHQIGHHSFGAHKRVRESLALSNEAIVFQRRHALSDASMLAEQNPILDALQDHTQQQYQQIVEVVGRSNQLEAMRRRTEEQATSTAITAHAAGAGQDCIARVVSLVPTFREMAVRLANFPIVSPRSPLSLVQFVPSSSDTSRLAVEFADNSPQNAQRLLASLDAYWRQRNRPILEEDSQRAPLPKERELPPCFEAGLCLHTPEGRRIFRARNSVLKAIKTIFRRNTPERLLLQGGHIVMRLLGKPSSSAAVLAGFLGEDDEDAFAMGLVYKFFHIAHTNFSPYKPVLQEMACLDLEKDDVVRDDAEVSLKAAQL
jgi:hypothetical protein